MCETEGAGSKRKNQTDRKNVYGLKGVLCLVKRGIQNFWSGNRKKRIQGFKQEWEQKCIVSKSKESTGIEQNRIFLYQQKAEHERKRLEVLLEKYQKDTACMGENVIEESGIREIELGVLAWFEKKWMLHETEEKVQFYLWLEADYLEHLRQFVYSKQSYFQNENRQNRYEAGTIGMRSFIAAAVSMVTYFIGVNNEYMWSIIQGIFGERILWRLVFVLSPVFLIVMALVLYYGFYLLFQASYIQKDNQLRQFKETWTRHVEAVAVYQQEMLEYIWNLGRYKNCSNQDEQDCMLMQEILTAWRKDNESFQKNMSKDSDKGKESSEK